MTAPSADAAPLLEVSRLTKRYPGVTALEDVSLHVDRGELVAVVGENGAGKSTLMKILAGIVPADEGEIRFEGRIVSLKGVLEAQAMGIALIHQELVLADNLDAAGNIYLGREPRRGPFLGKEVMRTQASALLARLNVGFSPDTLVSQLSLGQRQMVEIAKALSLKAKLVIMDEPTSSLSAHEAESLFRVIATLREQGISILYISHRLGEVKNLADRVVALRDGRNAGELPRNELSHEAMVRLMVGRDLSAAFPHLPKTPGPVALAVGGLRTQAHPGEVLDFFVREGEIVGMAGLVGAGRTEVLRALFGIEPALSGSITVAGATVVPRHPREAMAAGLALVPEDRKGLGVFLQESVRWNIALPSLTAAAQAGFWVDEAAAERSADHAAGQLRIKARNLAALVGTLSGGNQQKVVLGKWLALGPKVLLLDEPTRGIDVGAKREIYLLIEQLAAAGMAVLFASSEMEEVIAMSDRVLVMQGGRLSGELTRDEASEETILHLATAASPLAP